VASVGAGRIEDGSLEEDMVVVAGTVDRAAAGREAAVVAADMKNLHAVVHWRHSSTVVVAANSHAALGYALVGQLR